jgi:Cu+-exporting ATPase
MGGQMSGWQPLSMQISAWAQFAMATPVVVWGAAPFFARGLASIRNSSPNMFTLVSIGVGAAYLFREPLRR